MRTLCWPVSVCYCCVIWSQCLHNQNYLYGLKYQFQNNPESKSKTDFGWLTMPTTEVTILLSIVEYYRSWNPHVFSFHLSSHFLTCSVFLDISDFSMNRKRSLLPKFYKSKRRCLNPINGDVIDHFEGENGE